MRRLILLISFLILISSACSNNITENVQNEISENEISENENFEIEQNSYFSGFNEFAFPAYQAMFIIEFEGSEYEWEYQLTTRMDDSLIEYYLNIEGIDTSVHSGAIRLVTNGESSWMVGPGTDNHCFRYPNSMDIDMNFFGPDDLINSLSVNAVLEKVGEEIVKGQETIHYQNYKSSLSDWSNVSLDIWLASPDMVMNYLVYADGDDPLFDAGSGKLGFRYFIQEIGPQEIEPITGCEINYPIPKDSYNITRFPGLISFESTQDARSLMSFYMEEMSLIDWNMISQVESQDNFIQIAFQQAESELVITITPKDDSTLVEILEK